VLFGNFRQRACQIVWRHRALCDLPYLSNDSLAISLT
jgi:hypothetical protein